MSRKATRIAGDTACENLWSELIAPADRAFQDNRESNAQTCSNDADYGATVVVRLICMFMHTVRGFIVIRNSLYCHIRSIR